MGNIIGLKKFLEVLRDVHKFCILPTEDSSELIEESRNRMISRGRDFLIEIERCLELIDESLKELKTLADLVVINRRRELHRAVNENISYMTDI